jgi:hypothetical protein
MIVNEKLKKFSSLKQHEETVLENLPSSSSQSKEWSPKLVGKSRTSLQWSCSKRPKQTTIHYVTQVLPPVKNVR